MPRGLRPAQPSPWRTPQRPGSAGFLRGQSLWPRQKQQSAQIVPGLSPKCQRGTKSSLCLLLRGTSSLVFLLSKME